MPATSDSSSKSVLPCILPDYNLQPQQTVKFVPDRLKTSKGKNSNAITLTIPSKRLLDPMHWMHLNIYMAIASKQPISTYLVRPLSDDKCTFLNKGMSTNALRSRMRQLLESLHINNQETLHSTRRGRAMSMEAAGSSHTDIMAQLVMQTQTVLTSKYLPPGRSQRCTLHTASKDMVGHCSTVSFMECMTLVDAFRTSRAIDFSRLAFIHRLS